MHFSCSKMQRKAAGTDPELQASDVTALASPHAMVIILKAMRPSIKAGAGVMPLSTSGCVGRAESTSSGGCTVDTVGTAGTAAGGAPCPAEGEGLRKGERAAGLLWAVGLLWPQGMLPRSGQQVPSYVRVPTSRICPFSGTALSLSLVIRGWKEGD